MKKKVIIISAVLLIIAVSMVMSVKPANTGQELRMYWHNMGTCLG